MVSVNDLLLNDVTTDIRRKEDTWDILITIFLETTQSKNEELIINCFVQSTLHVSENQLVSSISEVVLDMSEKYININMSLTVPAVSFSTRLI